MITESELAQYINYPVESFNLEVKTWIDSKSDKGAAKIVKACIALRNSNGGMLIVGLSDDKKLDEVNRPEDIHGDFDQDYIQGLISKYASAPFEVEVRFVMKEEVEIPVIIVPSGLKTPVAIKRELKLDGNNTLLRANAIYVRTLAANNTVSTAEASGVDWERLTSICFENRESDIGQFIRRHLTLDNIALLSNQIGLNADTKLGDATNLDLGYAKFEKALQKAGIEKPDEGFFEASCLIQGQIITSYKADQDFLNLIASANRNLTGWPFWLDSRSFPEPETHPYVLDSGWEALIESDFNGNRLDFWRISPHGYFYAIRSLDDDRGGEQRPAPNTAFDPILAVWRVAEVLLLSVAFAKAMTYKNENSDIYVSFRWRGMENRELSDWSSNDGRYYNPSQSRQDIVEVNLVMPTDTPDSAIYQYVDKAMQPVVNIFGGAKVSTSNIENICSKIAKQSF